LLTFSGMLARFDMANPGAWLCLLNSISFTRPLWKWCCTPRFRWKSRAGTLASSRYSTWRRGALLSTGLLFSVLFAGRRITSRSFMALTLRRRYSLPGCCPLLNFIGAPNALLSPRLACSGRCLYGQTDQAPPCGYALAGVFRSVLAANYSARSWTDLCQGRLSRSQVVEYAHWNAISRIEVSTQLAALTCD